LDILRFHPSPHHNHAEDMNQARNINLRTLDGRTFNWGVDPEAAKNALRSDGWLVLLGASKLDEVLPELNELLMGMDESTVRSNSG